MRVLLLPGAFKGTLSAVQAGHILSKQIGPAHTVRFFPISDGGDGFIDSFLRLDPHARLVNVRAKNAFLQPKTASFLMGSDGKTAVLETARICGLGNTPKNKLDPLGASSYGVGQVLVSAVKHGARKIYVGLGGVACSDGGAGMLSACGAHLTDKNGNSLMLGAAPLLDVARIDLSPAKSLLRGVQLFAVADVTNPLLGPNSSAKVFGPQKGATPAQVKLLDKALARYARVLVQAGGRATAHTPSTAAAGAIAAGLYGGLNATLLLGTDFLVQQAHLEKQIAWADLVITCEGKLDGPTFCGKAPGTVLKLVQKYKKPVLFICGSADWKALAKHKLSCVCVAELVDFAPSVEEAQKNAGKYLARVGKSVQIF